MGLFWFTGLGCGLAGWGVRFAFRFCFVIGCGLGGWVWSLGSYLVVWVFDLVWGGLDLILLVDVDFVVYACLGFVS